MKKFSFFLRIACRNAAVFAFFAGGDPEVPGAATPNEECENVHRCGNGEYDLAGGRGGFLHRDRLLPSDHGMVPDTVRRSGGGERQ